MGQWINLWKLDNLGNETMDGTHRSWII